MTNDLAVLENYIQRSSNWGNGVPIASSARSTSSPPKRSAKQQHWSRSARPSR